MVMVDCLRVLDAIKSFSLLMTLDRLLDCDWERFLLPLGPMSMCMALAMACPIQCLACGDDLLCSGGVFLRCWRSSLLDGCGGMFLGVSIGHPLFEMMFHADGFGVSMLLRLDSCGVLLSQMTGSMESES